MRRSTARTMNALRLGLTRVASATVSPRSAVARATSAALGASCLLAVAFASPRTHASATVVFVDARATGADDGSSWADAYTRLDSALNATAGSADVHVWVAAGRYTPSAVLDRNASFVLAPGRTILGGFAGFETSANERDPARRRTILSGDLAHDDASGLTAENSLHVLRAEGGKLPTVIDGVHVEGGRADRIGLDAQGAGLLSLSGATVVRASGFEGNIALDAGGAVLVAPGATVTITDCVFARNAAELGGAIAVGVGADVLIGGASFHGNSAVHGGAIGLTPAGAANVANVVFTGNHAVRGGAIHAGAGATLAIDFATLTANAAGEEGGGLHGPAAPWVVRNSILYGNTAAGAGGLGAQIGPQTNRQIILASCVEGITPDASSNFALDPRFLDANGHDDVIGTEDDDVRLAHGSPALERGEAALTPTDTLDLDFDGDVLEPLPLDRAGRSRIDGLLARPDPGAYERALDCDGDGAPDELTASDCNGNAHPDACDVADGVAADLDADRRPDSCSTGIAFCSGDGTAAACPCGNVGTPGAGCANTLGLGARLSASGSASLTNDGLTLTASGLPGGRGLYFQGTRRADGGSGQVFGDGLRCAAGEMVRLAVRASTLGASELRSSPRFPISTLGSVHAPGTRVYQLWYRNAATFCTESNFNLSNAIEIQWRP